MCSNAGCLLLSILAIVINIWGIYIYLECNEYMSINLSGGF